MKKYLYGAAVQGIQGFIFQTNKLKEIAGASELVVRICVDLFEETFKETGKGTKKEDHTILSAAGNIKYLFYESENQQMEHVIKHFPKKVMEFAPGVTISQALVEIPQELDKEHIDELERKLRAQRNCAGRPSDVGFLATKRSRRTGLPATTVHERKGEDKNFRDQGTHKKITIIEKEQKKEEKGRLANLFFGENYPHELSLDFEKMAKSRSNNYSWLAIIHADGNNMGLMLQNLADEMKEEGKYDRDAFRKFSQNIQKSTEEAAHEAFRRLDKDDIKNEIKTYDDKLEKKNGFPYNVPFRPIVIGGDDLTIVCRADLALKYTSNFLSLFERKTKENFENLGYDSLKNGITACAGIAYVKYSFPFHFGYELAEELCSEAKKAAKKINPERTPSCVMFHKVQDSFVVDYNAIKEKELTTTDGVRFDFGPYFLYKEESAGNSTISEIEQKLGVFKDKEGSALKSHLRQWLTNLHNNPELAEQKIKRMLTTISQSKLTQAGISNPKNLFELRSSGDIVFKFTPVSDWLIIHSINEGGK